MEHDVLSQDAIRSCYTKKTKQNGLLRTRGRKTTRRSADLLGQVTSENDISEKTDFTPICTAVTWPTRPQARSKNWPKHSSSSWAVRRRPPAVSKDQSSRSKQPQHQPRLATEDQARILSRSSSGCGERQAELSTTHHKHSKPHPRLHRGTWPVEQGHLHPHPTLQGPRMGMRSRGSWAGSIWQRCESRIQLLPPVAAAKPASQVSTALLQPPQRWGNFHPRKHSHCVSRSHGQPDLQPCFKPEAGPETSRGPFSPAFLHPHHEFMSVTQSGHHLAPTPPYKGFLEKRKGRVKY